MSNYIRVLPRDLFNEASLLKCVGRLWILTDETSNHHARFETEDADTFDIVQDDSSGAIYIRNVVFTVRGVRQRLSRPLNSRGTWPLYLDSEDDDDDADTIAIFDDNGNLSAELLAYIRAAE